MSDDIYDVPLAPWAEGGKLPWNDPVFSERMLQEHLSQEHDGASRRLQIIKRHVLWLHSVVLKKQSSKILDIGCGPGLYTERLSRLGHECVGVDYSPAAIRYARDMAQKERLNCQYLEADITESDYGSDFDLAYFLFGELNAFRPEQMRNIVARMGKALKPGGHLVLEMFTLDFLQQVGEKPDFTETVDKGLFSEKPYQRQTESQWFADELAAAERNVVTDSATGDTRVYVNTLQGYQDKTYGQILRDAGFHKIKKIPSLGGTDAIDQHQLFVLYAQKDLD